MSDPSFPPPPPGPPPQTAAVDPYAPPKASITPSAITEDQQFAELTRRGLIKHETSIKSVGFLYLFSAFFTILSSIMLLFAGLADSEPGDRGFVLGIGLMYGVLGVVSIYLGRGLRRLDPKVRVGVTILAVLGLLLFPIGTLINGYILYLLHSESGKRIMSPEYHGIIAQTPHVKYATPLWLIILAIVLIVGFIAMIVGLSI